MATEKVSVTPLAGLEGWKALGRQRQSILTRHPEEWIHWGLIAFIFLLPFPVFGPDGRNIVLYLLFIAWLIWRRSGARLSRDQASVGWALLLYLTVAGMSLLVSADVRASLLDFQRVPLNGLILFLILSQEAGDTRYLARYHLALVWASTLITLYGLLGYFLGWGRNGGMVTSVYTWKNELGYLLAVSVSIVAWELLTTRDRVRRVAWALLAFVQFALLLLSDTRAALVAVIVSTLILTVALRRMKVLLVCIVAFMTLLAVSGQRIVTRHISIVQPSTYVAGDLSGRVDLWGGTLAMIRERPLLGYGYGWRLFARRAQAFANQTADARATSAPHAHNLFLETAYEMGLLGVAALCVLGGTVALVLIKRCRVSRSGDESSREMALLLLALYVVFGVISLTDYLLSDRLGALGWTLFAFAGALASETPWHGGTEKNVAGPPLFDASARRLPGRDRP
ncbi:MAG: O-antigen ligase family protein [candidate division NC10 bacterium]|nr:O-antigen ligase family protein [candidate division NC10 bacterium]